MPNSASGTTTHCFLGGPEALTSGSSPGPCAGGQLRSPSLSPNNTRWMGRAAESPGRKPEQDLTWTRGESSVCPGPALAAYYNAIRRDSLAESDVVASPSSSRGSPRSLRARSPRPAAPTTSRLALGSLFFPTHPPCPRGRQARTRGPHLRLLPGPVRGRPATLASRSPTTSRW